MEQNISNATTTQLNSGVSNFSVASQVLDTGSGKEIYYDFPDARQQLGYYKKIPELKKAVDNLIIWTIGKGYETNSYNRVILEHLTGWGEDSFQSISKNLLIQKKIFGDGFAEIIRDKDTGTLINLKPLFTGDMRVVCNNKGFIIRYEQRTQKGEVEKFKPNEILHICNDRIGNEIHGVSIIDACKWIIDARNEAMNDWRRISHRSTIRVLYVDIEDPTKLNTLREQYKEGIKNGEVLILPGKKGDIEFEDLTLPPLEAYLGWIQYLENVFYQAVGIPRVIASSQEYSEASSKVGYLTFEPIYTNEQTEYELDLWNKLGIKVKFNRPPSLSSTMQDSETKNTGQTGFQANEVEASVVKNE